MLRRKHSSNMPIATCLSLSKGPPSIPSTFHLTIYQELGAAIDDLSMWLNENLRQWSPATEFFDPEVKQNCPVKKQLLVWRVSLVRYTFCGALPFLRPPSSQGSQGPRIPSFMHNLQTGLRTAIDIEDHPDRSSHGPREEQRGVKAGTQTILPVSTDLNLSSYACGNFDYLTDAATYSVSSRIQIRLRNPTKKTMGCPCSSGTFFSFVTITFHTSSLPSVSPKG
ncbi:uncharacterized protein BDV14DRAFT_4487 [Aspergillus stella-maris]|uniref:uncharacterized protein n=1 Tax=Aspergillus stella-maris TaxID=1810926 RepID=UPI003CCD96BB